MARLRAIHETRHDAAGFAALTSLLHRLEGESSRHHARYQAERMLAA
jgi:hypothetical protein